MPRRRIILLALSVIAASSALAAGVIHAPVQQGYAPTAEEFESHAPDRLLVQFAPGAVPAELAAVPQRRGARAAGKSTGLTALDTALRGVGLAAVERPYDAPRRAARAAELGVDRWFLLRLDGATDLTALAERVRRVAGVAAVSLDWRAFPAVVPSDPLYPDHWGHANTAQLPAYDWNGTWDHTGPPVGTVGFDCNADQAWDAAQGYGDPGVVIAILDSGVDIDHPDLRLVAGYDFGSNDGNPDDDSANPGHGTACAGVAAAMANTIGVAGAAPGCSIMPCKVANNQGSMYFSSIQNALYWAADNGADVISMSLGAAISSDPATDAALQYAHDAGCTILAATGNENDNAISYPAIHPVVIGVGAASPCGERKRSSSNTGELNPGVYPDPNGYTCDGERWWGSNYGSSVQDAGGAVDIIAPTILPTTDIGGSGGYQPGDYEPFFNGTSCATPYAAGVAALVISANPGASPTQVRDALVSTARDVVSVESGTGWDRYTGYGLVDAAAAVGGGGPVAPTAAFSGSPLSGSYPLQVAFTDESGGQPASWSWNFGDGGSSTAQNPTHTYTAAGSYTVALTVTNAEGADTLTRTDYVTVTEPGVTTFVTATGETAVVGSVAGSYLDTYAADGVAESITEVLYTGHPRKRYSYLEHRWDFALPAGGQVTFHLTAARADNGDGDDFAFSYTTDGSTWLPLVTVASAAVQSYSVDLGTLSGAVTVRAEDTDRNWDQNSLDALSVDWLAFEVGDAQPVPPTAAFSGTPTAGEAPLLVSFTDASTGDPDSWSWDFGDGGTSSEQNPQHTFQTPGTYTVALTATNAQGADTATRTDYITVTEPGAGGTTMHVAAMAVTRFRSGPDEYPRCVLTVQDDQGQPVGEVTVSAFYDGPTGGTASGVTAADGSVTLEGGGMKKPEGEWCFEVSDLSHASLAYAPADNATTRSCESGDVFGADAELAMPREVALEANHPNPFNPATVIGFALPRAAPVKLVVYDVRGAVVEVLADGTFGAGRHAVTWNAAAHASGVYFYRLVTPGHQETRKMIMLK